jgi:hypothetical protein
MARPLSLQALLRQFAATFTGVTEGRTPSITFSGMNPGLFSPQ